MVKLGIESGRGGICGARKKKKNREGKDKQQGDGNAKRAFCSPSEATDGTLVRDKVIALHGERGGKIVCCDEPSVLLLSLYSTGAV